MMAEFWRSRSFKALNNIWNKKLHDADFIDAEVDIKGDRSLRQRADNSYRQASEFERDSKLEYFSLAGHLAHNTKFPNEVEEFIMIKHSEGAQIKEIVDELRVRGVWAKVGYESHRKTARAIIKEWKYRWGILTKKKNIK